MASSNSLSSPFPKWQIAFALGATGALGLGYWFVRNYSSGKSKKGNFFELGKKIGGSVDESNEVNESASMEALEIALKHKVDGNTFFKQGVYDKAIACYSKAIDDCPPENLEELATFYQNRAAAYDHLKKYKTVVEDCTKALELKKNYVKALLRRAHAFESMKEWSDCLDDVSAVCLLQSFQDQSVLVMADRVLKEVGRLHATEEMAKRVPITPSKNFIKTYFSSFSEDPVYNLIVSPESTVKGNKGFARAKKSFLANNYEDIISSCTEEINLSDTESTFKVEAILLRATFHLLRGDHDKALSDFETIISNEQIDYKIRVNALVKRASLYMQLEETEECLSDFDAAAELGPNISDVFHHRGQVKILMEHIDEATNDFNRAVELNPDFPIAYIQKCYSDYRLALNEKSVEKIDQSMNDFETAVKRFPKCAECCVLYAQVLTDQQQFEKADKYYDTALSIDSSNATILVHKGLLYLQWTGDVEKATKFIRKAIKKDPLCEFAYETLATVEVQRGNLVESIDLFEKAIKLAKTELEMTHLFSLKDAAHSQLKVSEKLGLSVPTMML